MLDRLVNPNNSKKTKKRIGRGSGSGMGKTSTKGHKGQKARAGNSKRRRIGFEGGQMPLYRRLPKVGFTSMSKDDLYVLTLENLMSSKSIDKTQPVSLKTLIESGNAQKTYKKLKVIGNFPLDRKINVETNLISKGAKAIIEKAGGSVNIL